MMINEKSTISTKKENNKKSLTNNRLLLKDNNNNNKYHKNLFPLNNVCKHIRFARCNVHFNQNTHGNPCKLANKITEHFRLSLASQFVGRKLCSHSLAQRD